MFGANSTLEYFSEPLVTEEVPHTRFNDGGCDSKGRFFAGTLYSPEHGIPGRLYKYDPFDKSCVVVDDGPFTVRFKSSLNIRTLMEDNPRIPMDLAGVLTRKPCQSLYRIPQLWIRSDNHK